MSPSNFLLVFLNFFFAYSQIIPNPTANQTGTCDEPSCPRPTGFTPNVHIYNFTVTSQVLPGTNETKPSVVVNGLLPGPTIEVNESDIVIVNLINEMADMGVTIHWHGLFQFTTSYNDGIPNISQCLQPGSTISQGEPFVYVFRAEPAGTTWWHGHYNNLYIDGLFGPLIIHRRGGDLYQQSYSKEWIWTVNDWYDFPAALLRTTTYLVPSNPDGVEPEPDAIMVNGFFTSKLIYDQVDPTQRVLVRVINAAGFSMFNVSVDNMLLDIVAIDGVDIDPPLVVPWVVVNVAQRVDIILDFPSFALVGVISIQFHFDAVLDMYPVDILNYTQPSPPYPPNTKCRFDPNFIGTIAFVEPTKEPTTTPLPLTQRVCPSEDINYLDARPFDYIALPEADYSINMTISFQILTDVQLGCLNNKTFPMDTIGDQYGMPELYAFVLQSANGTAEKVAVKASGPGPALYSDDSLRFYIPDNAVVDIWVFNQDSGDHPFHLHGHNFPIIATSDCPEAEQAFAGNYLRRDTVSVPKGSDDGSIEGWARLRLVAKNPGVWMFHCHIDWHVEAGLACLFMESPKQVFLNKPPPDQSQFCQMSLDQEEDDDDDSLAERAALLAVVGAFFLFGSCWWCFFRPKRQEGFGTSVQ